MEEGSANFEIGADTQLLEDLPGSPVEHDFAYAPSTKKFLKKAGSRYE